MGTHKQMAGTRVLLEFGDGKKYWNLIDPTLGETIQDVICSIELKFSVKCEELLLEDAVLPPKESIRIFRDKDLIRVVKKKKHLIQNEEVTSEELVNSQIEQEKCSESETTIKTKKKKHKYRETENVPSVEEIHLETTAFTAHKTLPPNIEDNNSVKPKEKKRKQVELEKPETSNEDVPMLDEHNQDSKTCETVPDEVQTLKRKRRRRRSHHKNVSELVDIPPIIEYLPPPKSKERKHIHFEDQEPAETSSVTSQQEQPCSFESIPETSVSSFKSAATPSTHAWSPSANSSPKVSTQFNALMALKQKPTVFSRNCTEKITAPIPETVPQPISIEQNNHHQLEPTKYPLCIGPPRMGDIIAYKVLELSETYCPEVSDYRQGRITEIQPNGQITVEIIGDPIYKRNFGGKFELMEDDEEQDEEFETVTTYNWNELIEPRLVFP